MQQQHRVFAAAALVGTQQGFELDALVAGTRVGVTDRPRGAYRAAGATTDTQVGVDLDLLAMLVTADGAGRTHVDAGIATHLLVAAVGAKLLLVGKKLGLLKLAHQLAPGQQGFQVAPVPVQIALRFGVLAEGRCAAQIQHQVKGVGVALRRAVEVDGTGHLAHLDAGAVVLASSQVNLVVQANGILGAGRQAGVAAGAQVQVNRVGLLPGQLKRAQPAGQALNLAAQHQITTLLGRALLPRALGEQRGIDRVAQQLGSSLCRVQRANDQRPPGALVSHRGHRLGFRQVGGSQQGGDLGAGLGGITAPAAGFADVDKLDRCAHLGLVGQLAKQTGFLGAGHHQVVAAACGFEEFSRFAAAQAAVQRQRLVQARTQSPWVQRQGLVAVANQGGHVGCLLSGRRQPLELEFQQAKVHAYRLCPQRVQTVPQRAQARYGHLPQ